MPIKTITIRNPMAVKRAEHARDAGLGRDAAEAAENLILDPRSAAELLEPEQIQAAPCPVCSSMTPAGENVTPET